MKRFFLSLVFVSFCLYNFCAGNASSAVIHLSEKDFLSSDPILIKGPWEIYWNKLLKPSDFKENAALKPDALINSTSFNDLKIQGKKEGGTGYATYRIGLKNLPQASLALMARSLQTSYRVYINDSLMAEVGLPGIDKEHTIPMNRDVLIYLPQNQKEITITVQVANFHHRKGGFVQPFEIGLASNITRNQTVFYLLDVIESSALAIIGLFLLALYIFRRKDLSILYFSLFCMTLSFRPVIAVNYLLADLFNGINWSLMLKMEYLGVLFPCLFMLLFIKKLFPEQLPSFIVRILEAILLIKISITITCPPSVFSWLIPPLLIIIPVGVLVFAITIIRAMNARIEGSKQAGIGLVILLGSLILKVLVYANVIPPVYPLITGMDIAFIFMMSLILGSRFSLQFSKVERLQQTTEIQHREIQQKKKEVEIQKELIEQKQTEIIDSIKYAKRIQDVLLAHENLLKANIPDHFVYFNPKDIVSGDFYWATSVNVELKMKNDKLNEHSSVASVDSKQINNNDELFYLAVCDSTGHGVPGAFMSLLNIGFLSEAINEKGISEPNEIFNFVRKRLIDNISKEGQKDGFDGVILRIHPPDSSGKIRVVYAAANNSPVLVKNNELIVLQSDRMPVGYAEKLNTFSLYQFEAEKGDCIYLFTDGFADQFGGERGKKFKQKQLTELLHSISNMPIEEQKQTIKSAFENWKNKHEQVDDVCVLGIKL